MKLGLREVGSLWDSVTEGWRHLWESARGALTRFRPGDKTNLPQAEEVEDESFLPSLGWAMLGGEVFEDDTRVVVRLEVPGMDKADLDIQVEGDSLVVSGEKRFERESTQGRWHTLQCAYGSFRRVIPLPVPVKSEEARASYRNGVLRVELPKLEPGRRAPRSIPVE
ncbi:MAG: Hsp20/alpha crystallin family protein [Burkholderiales bacterium]